MGKIIKTLMTFLIFSSILNYRFFQSNSENNTVLTERIYKIRLARSQLSISIFFGLLRRQTTIKMQTNWICVRKVWLWSMALLAKCFAP